MQDNFEERTIEHLEDELYAWKNLLNEERKKNGKLMRENIKKDITIRHLRHMFIELKRIYRARTGEDIPGWIK